MIARSSKQHGFSLAELMIAIVILGLGLLFIAAALPVGIEYSRRNVERAEAEAAGLSAMERILMSLDARDARDYRPIFRPQILGAPAPDDDYEPVIKVRPFTMTNLQARTFGAASTNRVGFQILDLPEVTIAGYLARSPVGPFAPTGLFPTVSPQNEYHVDSNGDGNPDPFAMPPLLPAVERFYPVVPNVDRRTPQFPLPILQEAPDVLDAIQNLGQRLAWTAFYRRVSYPKYDETLPGDGFRTAPIEGNSGDPTLYEVIVIVTQRPSENHVFARQSLLDGTLNAFLRPQAVSDTVDLVSVEGNDRLAPTPWLVLFQQIPSAPFTVTDNGQTTNGVRRYIPADAPVRPTMRFVCTERVGDLLPVGSIIIPARNDYHANAPLANNRQLAGFTPSDPEHLPIYEVIERPNPQTVIVKNNGSYPWLGNYGGTFSLPGLENAVTQLDIGGNFPCWVIPPAFEGRAADGTPLFDQRSPVLRVIRRLVRVVE